MEPIVINMDLADQKVKFIGASAERPEIKVAMDYVPPLGSGEGLLGLEMLVMSCAGCVSTAVVALLRRMGKTIDSYRVTATGERLEKPLSVKRIDLAITVVSPDIENELNEAIIMSEAMSPVWVSIRDSVAVTCHGTVERP